jgi:hypothetical protein
MSLDSTHVAAPANALSSDGRQIPAGAATYRTRRARESRWKARGHCANSRLLTLPEIRDDLLVRRAKSTGTHGRYGYLVPFQLVEFYAQSGEARNALYVSC